MILWSYANTLENISKRTYFFLKSKLKKLNEEDRPYASAKYRGIVTRRLVWDF